MAVTDGALPSPGAQRVARHRARQAPPRERPAARRHGLRALDRLLRQQGLAALDQRSTLARELAHWRQCLADDLGGDPSTAQTALIERVAAKRVMVGALEVFLLQHPSAFLGKEHQYLATLYRQMTDSLRADLLALGLERRAVDVVPDLTAYIASKKDTPRPKEDTPTCPSSQSRPSSTSSKPFSSLSDEERVKKDEEGRSRETDIPPNVREVLP